MIPLKITQEDFDRLSVGDIFIAQIDRVEKTPYAINGKEDAVLQSEEGVFAYIPSNEYSVYQNRITQPQDTPGLIYKLEVIGKEVDGETHVLKASLRSINLRKREDQLETFKDAGYVQAKIFTFTPAGALLKYNNLVLTMIHASFNSGNKEIKIQDVLNKGDVIEVIYHKVKKRGREIRVLPRIALPTPEWKKEHPLIKEGDTMIGMVDKVSSEFIYIILGNGGPGQPRTKGSARHPVDPMLDSLVDEGIEVIVHVDGVANNGYCYLTIKDIIADSTYDYKLAYMREVAKHDAS